MKLKKLCIFVLALLMTSFLIDALPFNVSAEPDLPVHNIDTGLDYATIWEAINADETLNGHTVYVDAGTYYEHVVVNKSVALVGENKFNTIVDGRGEYGHVFYVTANNVNITGFTIQNSVSGYSGIHVYNSGSNNMSHNIIKNNKHGIYLFGSSNNTIGSNNVSNNEYGIRLYESYNNTVRSNSASDNGNGISLELSNYNVLSGNNVSSNDGNGIYLYDSGNNTVSRSIVSNNGNGIRVHASSDNILSDNKVSNSEYGFYLYTSSDNALSGNNVSSNEKYGIYLHHSRGNILLDNKVSNSSDGIYLYGSGNNTITSNIASDNGNGISLELSNYNVLSGNNVSFNSKYGTRLQNSSNNIIFHNNFIRNKNNTEQPSNTSFCNSWDNGVEGNYWSDYNGTDENRDGIGDTPYLIDERVWLGVYSRDNYPLMAKFLQFKVAMENLSYAVYMVSNSTISRFQYHHDPDGETNAVSFNATGEDETFGFCRICIPHILVRPPYTVRVDDDSPLHNNTVRTNGTHTWLYFTYHHSEREVTIIHTPLKIMPVVLTVSVYPAEGGTSTPAAGTHEYAVSTSVNVSVTVVEGYEFDYWELDGEKVSEETTYTVSVDKDHTIRAYVTPIVQPVWSRWSFWAILGLTVVAVVLLSLNFRYHRMLNEQKKVIQAYSPLEVARTLFKADVRRRRVKIGKFEEKYGVRIRPRDTLEDVIRRLKEKVKH